MKPNPCIAFVIDALPSLGGGEKVLFTALEAFPNADVFSLVYNRQVFCDTPLAKHTIRTSFIDRVPYGHTHHRMFLPLMPTAIELFNLRDYDIIVSFSYAVAHGIINYNGARHVSYTFTPMRYAWTDLNIDGRRTAKNPFLNLFLNSFRKWDVKAASRVHQFAAISQTVSQRIQDAYQRPSHVIYPPVNTSLFNPSTQRDDYYAIVTRLVPHKRIDIAVKAFTRLGLPLVIAGVGPELNKLRSMAGPTIKFIGYCPDAEVAKILNRARGYISTTEEDFGIAIVEAQSAGCPVISIAKGGALETVINGKTGLFFEEQSTEALIETIQKFEKMDKTFNVDVIAENAKRFDKSVFLNKFRDFVVSH